MSESTTKLNAELLSLMLGGQKIHVFEDSLEESGQRIIDSTKDSKALNDEYGNSLLAIGSDDKVEKFTNFSLDNDTLNWPLWLTLYNSSWVFRRAIDKPSQDEIRCGVAFQGQEDKSKVYATLKQHRDDFIQLLQWGALFGGSIACMMFDNFTDEEYAKHIDYNKASRSRTLRLYVVDRWYGVQPSDELVDDMNSLDFGKPAYYNVTLADGHTVKFHHSFVLRYEHRTAPKLIKNGMLQGWGYAEGAHIFNEISRDEKLKASVQSLINKSLIEVIKMSGMRGIFMSSDQESNDQLKKRLEMVNWARDYNSLTFLDKDDEYQMNSFSGLAGLSDLLEKNMWLISAALEMQGVLFGDLKQGFSNDTEALERYDETINGRCETFLRPVYTKFFKTLYKIYGINEKVEFTFNSLLVKTKVDQQIASIGTVVDLFSKLLNDGVFGPKDYALALKNYVENGTIDLGLTKEKIDKLDEEGENFNLGADLPKV